MNYLIFFFIVLLVLFAGYSYVGFRLLAPLHLPAPWNLIAWAGLAILLALPLVLMVLTVNRKAAGLIDVLSWVGYGSLGLFSFLFTVTVVKDLGLLAWVLAHKVQAAFGSGSAADAFDPERRRMLIRGIHLSLLGVAGGATAYGIFEARRRPGIVEIEIPLPHLPDAFDGFRIVQFTDVHAGLTVARPFVETVTEMVRELNGDLIAFTGDLVDGSVERLREHVEPLASLNAPHGKFYITGNHEYYSGAEQWVEEAKRLGFDTLINEHRVIERNGSRFILGGVTDISGGQFVPHHKSDPAKAFAGSPDGLVRVLLAHQPRSLPAAQAAGADLVLSGHTHGGQFFPWNLVAGIGQPLLKGLKKFDATWMYVSKGTGYWGPPIRLAARSEITVVTLRKEENGSSLSTI